MADMGHAACRSFACPVHQSGRTLHIQQNMTSHLNGENNEWTFFSNLAAG